MSDQDKAMKTIFNDPVKFADFVNANVFSGAQVITADMVEPLDIEMIIPLKYWKDRFKYFSRVRDVFKSIRWDDGSETFFLCFGVEGQNEIDYTMVHRIMAMNAISYLQMAEGQRKENKASPCGSKYLKSGAEFMSGLKKGQRLPPVITFVFYTGMEPWNAPLSLYEAVEIPDELKKYVPDYHINLVWGADKEGLENYKSSLYNIIKFLWLSRTGEIDMAEDMSMSAEEAVAVAKLSGNKQLEKIVREKRGEVNMPNELVRVLNERADEKARQMAGPMAEKMAGPIAEKMAEKMAEQKDKETAISLYKDANMTSDTISRTLRRPVSEIETWISEP